MKQNVKVLIGVAVIAAVAVGAWTFGNGSLFQGRVSTRRDISSKASAPSAPVDLSVGVLQMADTNYNGVPYYRVTVGIKSNAPQSEWRVNVNSSEYTQYLGWQTVPANANTDYSFDIMQSVACEGGNIVVPSVEVKLDPNNNIAESDETNQWYAVYAKTPCPAINGISRGDAANVLYNKLLSNGYKFTSTISNSPVFSDVPKSSPYFNAVQSLYAEGLFPGYTDGTFKPGNSMTRSEATKLLISQAPKPGKLVNEPYDDVNDVDWYSSSVVSAYSIASEKGVEYELGFGSKFFPNSKATPYFTEILLKLW